MTEAEIEARRATVDLIMQKKFSLPLPEPLHRIGKHWIDYAQEDGDNNDIAYAIWAALYEASLYAQRDTAPAQPSDTIALERLLQAAHDWILAAPHGDNCFLHDDGGEFDRCFCGKDSLLDAIHDALV